VIKTLDNVKIDDDEWYFALQIDPSSYSNDEVYWEIDDKKIGYDEFDYF